MAPRRIDDVQGEGLGGKDPQPGRVAADAPAGFVDAHGLGQPKGEDHLDIHAEIDLGHALVGADEGGAADGEAKGDLKEAGDFGVRHAQVVFRFGGQGEGAWAEREIGRAERV